MEQTADLFQSSSEHYYGETEQKDGEERVKSNDDKLMH